MVELLSCPILAFFIYCPSPFSCFLRCFNICVSPLFKFTRFIFDFMIKKWRKLFTTTYPSSNINETRVYKGSFANLKKLQHGYILKMWFFHFLNIVFLPLERISYPKWTVSLIIRRIIAKHWICSMMGSMKSID